MGFLIALILGVAMHAADAVIQKRKAERDRITPELKRLLMADASPQEGGRLNENDVLGHVSLSSREHRAGRSVGWIAWIIVLFWLLAGWYDWRFMAAA